MKLKEFRQLESLSVEEMAERLGIAKTYYYKLEEGLKKPSYKLMKKFCDEFPKADIRLVFFE